MIDVDLHVHTCYSKDSLTALPTVLAWAKRRRLGAIAITDHDTIEGALALADLDDLPVIVGEEIKTSEGEIIGLFLKEWIAPGETPAETVRAIHAQGGLVYVPHARDELRHSTLTLRALLEILPQVDLIEALNARVTRLAANDAALALAQQHGLPCGAGSDAHQGFEIGRAFVRMPRFSDAASFMESIRRGELRGHVSSPLVHVGSSYARIAKSLMALAAPGH